MVQLKKFYKPTTNFNSLNGTININSLSAIRFLNNINLHPLKTLGEISKRLFYNPNFKKVFFKLLF